MNNLIPIGYQALIEQIGVKALPHFRVSYITLHGGKQLIIEEGKEIHIYPKGYQIDNPSSVFEQMEFAIKYEGLNLEILKTVLKSITPPEMEHYIIAQPTSKYRRILWYLYELLLGKTLNISDIKKGPYIDLLDQEAYYTCNKMRKKRYRINDNLLGNKDFCPVIRKTPRLLQYEKEHIENEALKIFDEYDSRIVSRATNYLYTKETMSSFEIEREKPDKTRSARFIELLQEAGQEQMMTKEKLIELQNAIVDSKFAAKDYRHFQNYIGSLSPRYESVIHYIAPRPEEVFQMMQGLLDSMHRMLHSKVHPVLITAAISFGFVFIHPFEDGNGRLHRFIIHQIFASTEFVPKGMIFPISATMLKNLNNYDYHLESFSVPLMSLINKGYHLSDKGEMRVDLDTGDHYRYLDYTLFAEYLFTCLKKTIEEECKKELNFLVNYDLAKQKLQEIVSLPDKKIDLFIKAVMQNNGELSKNKRKDLFEDLSDETITKMQEALKETKLL